MTYRNPLFALWIAGLALLLGMAMTAPAQAAEDAASATTFYVNAASGDDANDCLTPGTACRTIAAAIDKADDGDTIQIGAGIYHESNLSTGKDLSLMGAGAASTIVDAERNDRIFVLWGRTTVQDMTLRNGLAPDDPNVYSRSGGAIRILGGGHVTLRNLALEDNESTALGGAIFNAGHLTVEQSQIRNNQSNSWGGGIYHIQLSGSQALTVTHSLIAGNESAGSPGIHLRRGRVVIEDSHIRDNRATGASGRGGGLYVENFLATDPAVRVARTTISGNRAWQGGGIFVQGATLDLINATVSGNQATHSYGGIHLQHATNQVRDTLLNMSNSTVTGNFRVGGFGSNGLVTLSGAIANVYNSIIAGNPNLNCTTVGTDSVINSLGHNLSSDASCFFAESSDLPNTDPLLMPLGDYGGPTPTHALRPGSPAIDAGGNVNCPATDQRGIPRPFDGDASGTARCDMGAVEAQRQLTIVEAISFAEGTGGTNTAVFTVTLSPVSSQVVTVDYATEDGTGENAATSPADFAATSGTLTFQPGETVKTIGVPIVTDNVIEPDETFYVNLSNPSGAVILIGRSTATILNDDSPPTINISDAEANEGNSGTRPMTFDVTLSLDAAEVVTVNWATQDGTGQDAATAPDDYIAASGSLTFQPGETAKQITVQIVGDVIDEGESEQFRVVLSNPVNANLGKATGIGTIIDDDIARLRLAGVQEVFEGDSGLTPVPMTVTLTNPAAFVVTVDYSTRPRPVANSATPGEDYEEISGTLTFQPGETEKNFAVNVIGDTVPEADEEFIVEISNGTVPIAFSLIFVTILNDDDAPRISIDDVSVAEGDSGTTPAVFTVSLSTPSAQTISVDYATQNRSAIAPQDYIAVNGTLTFQPGITSQTITVQVVGDVIDERESEEFWVELSNPVNVIPGKMRGVGTIIDDDQAILSFASGPEVTVGESGATPAVFIVNVSTPAAYSINVEYEVRSGQGENGAIAGEDFTGDLSGTLTFGPMATQRTFSVDVPGHTEPGPNKTFTAHLSNANVPITVDQATATILNDNSLTPILNINDISVNEGDSGLVSAVFTVTLLNPPADQSVTVDFATQDDTATAPDDYIAASGSLTFQPGQTTRQITVQVVGDVIDEGASERFQVVLSNPVNGVLGKATGTATIIDDDTARLALATGPTVTVGESGDTPAVFTVNLSTPAAFTINVDYEVRSGQGANGAIAGEDFTGDLTGTLTFGPGATQRTFSVDVPGQTGPGPDKTFTAHLSNANVPITAATTTATILGDDDETGVGGEDTHRIFLPAVTK